MDIINKIQERAIIL